jgi:hypothetical protein
MTMVGAPRNQSHLRRRDIAKDHENAVRKLQSQPFQVEEPISPGFN